MAYNFEEPKQSEKLLQDPGHSLKLYQEQFKHLRHLENADDKALIFITSAVLAIFVLFHLPYYIALEAQPLRLNLCIYPL